MPGPSRSSGSHSKARCSSSEPRHRDWSRCSHYQSQPGYDAVSLRQLAPPLYIIYYNDLRYFCRFLPPRLHILHIFFRKIGAGLRRRWLGDFSAGAMLSTSRSDFDLWNGGGHPPFPLCRLRHAATVPSGIVSVGSSEARAEP